MSGLSHDNHFVPQGYLRNWSDDGVNVLAYRTLVPHERVPDWTPRSIRGIAFRRDLYTQVDRQGNESDAFEQWMATEIETPALAAIDRAIHGRRLAPDDWKHLSLFYAAQDVRTPSNFLECMERWREDLPGLIQRTLAESVERIQQASREGTALPVQPVSPSGDTSGSVDVTIQREKNGSSKIYASVTTGRAMWVQEMRRLLDGIAKGLEEHKWSIARPAPGLEWITSDHPALKLNYNAPTEYDFGGGWGSRGTELILPISPQHLLYTQIGSKAAPRFTFSAEKTQELRKLLAERAYRWIFAGEPLDDVVRFRPRVVDAATYQAEELTWQSWHRDQSASETRPTSPAPSEDKA